MRATLPFRLARPFAAGSLAVLLALTTGCGGGRGSVKGKVTVGGKPLPAGLITFVSEGGNKDPFPAAIKNGEYAIPDMPAAPAKVYIVPPLTDEPPPVDKGDLNPPPKGGRQPKIVVLPKYQNVATSGLSVTVKRGENTFDVDLTP